MQAKAIIELVRPRQWTKNLAVFAGVIFSGALADRLAVGRAGLAFVALCLVSAGLYALNDAADAEQEVFHGASTQWQIRSLFRGALEPIGHIIIESAT